MKRPIKALSAIRVDDELRSSTWSIIADGSSIHANDVEGLKERILAIESQAGSLLSGTDFDRITA